MDKQSLEQKRDDAEKRFNELQEQESEVQKEMLRQQGAYQLAVQLLKDLAFTPPPPKAKQSSATTISVEPEN